MPGESGPKVQAGDKRHKEQCNWQGRKPWIYRPGMWLDASAIRVARFRQILIWPLTLRLPEGNGGGRSGKRPATSDAMKEFRGSLAGTPWDNKIDDLLDHAPPPRHTLPGDTGGPDFEREMDEAQHYAEFVYFHDFVQRMIFHRRTANGEAWTPFTLHARKDIAKVEFDIGLSRGSGRFVADVKRCNLYLFDTGAAVLALEIDFGLTPTVVDLDQGGDPTSPHPMTLADVQTFADHARRAHALFQGREKCRDKRHRRVIRESAGAGLLVAQG